MKNYYTFFWARNCRQTLTPVFLLVVSFVLLIVWGEMSVSSVPNLVLDKSYLLYFALGIALILSVGEIDVSMFGIASLSVMLTMYLSYMGGFKNNAFLICLFIIILSMFFTYLNALLVTKLKWDSLIGSIVLLMICQGGSLFMYNKTAFNKDVKEGLVLNDVYNVPDYIYYFMDKELLYVNVRYYMMFLLLVIIYLWLKVGKMHLKMIAVGQNEHSARLSGVNNEKVKLFAYLLAGSIYGIGAIFMFSQFNKTSPSDMNANMIEPIMCAVLAGSSVDGGRLPIIFNLVSVATFALIYHIVLSKLPGGETYQMFFGFALFVYLLAKNNIKRRVI